MIDPDHLIAQRARAIDASGIRKVFDLAASIKNPINLSIGQPDFDVPEPIKAAAAEAIAAGKNSYTVTQGIPPLHQSVRARFDARFQRDGRWNDYGTLITSGVSGALLLALMATIDAGDEVLIGDPYFVMYKHLATMAGGKPVFIDTYPDFKLTADRVEPHITDRTKVLLISSPSNPTGVVTPDETWRGLVELCESRGILLISDEIYDVFHYAGQCPSPAAFSDQLLVLRGFSKTYAMTGWRLGYAIGPRAIVEQMTKLQQYTFVCAPSMVQQAGLAAMDVDMSKYVASYAAKRDRVIEKLSPHFELATPGGAFYAFPKVPTDETATEFVKRAIARELLIIPGNVFSERDTHFRISYACADDTLDRGLDLLIELAGG
ncbi:aminotransferase class I/II-fold pyridoxal phosphate-dependent enzyme [Planctomycetales bacterium ZRK34]|nr:aminotransferase class I/II-fold pyridoxal phosphate-dependent enzyme [Planctomycetales bacterium ZRK34]